MLEEIGDVNELCFGFGVAPDNGERCHHRVGARIGDCRRDIIVGASLLQIEEGAQEERFIAFLLEIDGLFIHFFACIESEVMRGSFEAGYA